jgi:hypothetical protein
MQFTKITKAAAKKRFAANQPVYLCPCKMRPGGPFNSACLIFGKEYLEQAEGYRNNDILWKGNLEATAWNLMYNNWAFYNTSYETGYYAAYYIETN